MSLFAGSLTTGKLFNGGLFYNENEKIFQAPLITTLIPSIGNYVPTFTRNTTASVTDFEGIIRTTKLNEARFVGARRVENLYGNSETLATQGVSVAAGTYTVSFTGTGTITFSGAYSGLLVGTGASNRVETTFSAGAGTLTSTVSGSVLKAQCEDVTGQSVQTASEYVSNGVLSYPYHGTGADGVKCFATKLDGTPIDSSVLKGYLSEGLRTNLALYSNDFSNPVWIKTNISQTSNIITATSNNATILQAITATTASYCFSVQIKRKTGTGGVSITVDNGSTWSTVTVTSSWKTFYITGNISNPVFGIKLTNIGDEIYVRNGQLEQSYFPSSTILTTSASVTRTGDQLLINFGLPGIGSTYAEVTTVASNTNSGIISIASTLGPLYYYNGTSVRFFDGTNSPGLSRGGGFSTGIRKIAARWDNLNSKMNIFKDGGSSVEGPYAGTLNTTNYIYIGNYIFFGNIKNVQIWNKALTDPELVSMTS